MQKRLDKSDDMVVISFPFCHKFRFLAFAEGTWSLPCVEFSFRAGSEHRSQRRRIDDYCTHRGVHTLRDLQMEATGAAAPI
ncbi:hypothetical protein SCA6_001622 [Theobroma cacao]